jgi:metal-responsive CopG/Arc/MetJ family transcriptional regulator
MALKNVQRYTISLPKTVVRILEINVPKNKRSKFIAELIEKNLISNKGPSLEETQQFWIDFNNTYPDKNKKNALEMQREDRLSH